MKKLLSTIAITGSFAMLLFGFTPKVAVAVTMEYVPTYTYPGANVEVASLRWYYDATRWPSGNACIYFKDVNNVLTTKYGDIEGWICDGDGALIGLTVMQDQLKGKFFTYFASSNVLQMGDPDGGYAYVLGTTSITRYSKISLWGKTFIIPVSDLSSRAPYASVTLHIYQRDRNGNLQEKGTISMEMKLNRVQ